MNKKTLVAGLVTTSLLAATLAGGVGTASAAPTKWSDLTVTPVEPKVADVCWTPYEDDTGAVALYRLTEPKVADAGLVLDPATEPPVDNQYCITFSTLDDGVWYDFELEAFVNGSWVTATETQTVQTRGYVLTAKLRPATVKPGGKVTISGSLKSASKGVSGATVIVQQRVLPGDTWKKAGVVTTNGKGNYSKSIRVKRNIKLRTYFRGVAGGPQTVGAWNSDNPVDVSPVFSLRFSKNPVRRGATVRTSGVVKAGSVALLAGDPICIQRHKGRGWKSLNCVPISAKGRFTSRITADRTGKDLRYRWHASRVGPEYVAGNSRARVLKVT